MLPGEMRSAAKVVTGTAKLIGSLGWTLGAMIRVVILSHVLARLRGAGEKKLRGLLIGMIGRERHPDSES